MDSLPTEVLEEILNLVESTSDLLSFALASTDFLRIIIPYHLHVRHIACQFRRINVWRSLGANPIATSRCRQLHILWGSDSGSNNRIPPMLTCSSGYFSPENTGRENSINACFKALAQCIRKMPQLTTFVWSGDRRPSSVIYDALLRSCPRLLHVDLWLHHELGDIQHAGAIASLAGAPLRRLSNLTQFAYTDHLSINDEVLIAHIKLLTSILRSSPAIEDIWLKFTGFCSLPVYKAEMLRLFRSVQWPHLRRLSIHGYCLHEVDEAFFRAHPTLESVMLRDNSQNRSDVSFANLRGLKSLDINFLPADPWSQIPPEVLTRLDHLGLEIGMPDEGRLNGILALSVNLTSLVLCWIDYEPGQLIRIAQNAPQLERLGIRWNIYNDAVESIRNDLSPWRSVLKSLLHLTHLGAIPLEAFFPPLDGSWYQQGWATQGVGLGDRISTAVERLCLAEDAAQLQRIHFISDMNGTNDIWAFLDPLTHQVKQFSVLPELEDAPKGLFDIPWSGCFIAGLETNHDPIGCGTSNPAKLPTWPY